VVRVELEFRPTIKAAASVAAIISRSAIWEVSWIDVDDYGATYRLAPARDCGGNPLPFPGYHEIRIPSAAFGTAQQARPIDYRHPGAVLRNLGSLIHRLKTHFGVRMIAVILEDTMGRMNFAKRRGLSLAVAAALVTAAGAAPSIAYAQHHGGGGGISTGAAVGLGLGAFALGSAAGAGAYGYPYGYGYGYYPPTAYYPPAPAYYAPRSCWDPYYRRYYAC
jgi:hypothetical protein